ncbi:D-tyrosyl-tRNA(Tyr) deacylase [bacterium]|nr:D-tyrosyl-tRNA(Tyr) deacylase [bacterium]
MRAVVQRVLKSSVKVNKKIVSETGNGILVFLAIKDDDDTGKVKLMVDKIINLRIFSDSENKLNLSLKDVRGEIMLVSQFTLYGNTKKGSRPSFIESAKPEKAKKLFDLVFDDIRYKGIDVKKGVFQEDMEVFLINNGPVTVIIDI